MKPIFITKPEALLVRYNPQRPTVILAAGGKGLATGAHGATVSDKPNDINDVIWRHPGATGQLLTRANWKS